MDAFIKPVGDQAALVVFEQRIAEDVNQKVMALKKQVEQLRGDRVLETVPAFASLLVYYNPLKSDYASMEKLLKKLVTKLKDGKMSSGRTIEIPVCYGGKYGEDLEYVAKHAGLSREEVIRIQSGQDYLIYMLGFLPGFPYLGGLDQRLFTPRLDNPRTRIPAGSVGIGGEQTGIYPMESPGGWQLIGRTPLNLFSPDNGGKLMYEAGDRIRFVPISEAEYKKRVAEWQ